MHLCCSNFVIIYTQSHYSGLKVLQTRISKIISKQNTPSPGKILYSKDEEVLFGVFFSLSYGVSNKVKTPDSFVADLKLFR